MLYQGYSNRSTILFRAGEFMLCAEDVNAALDYSGKQEKEFILMDRKAKCLMKDGTRREEARDGIQSNCDLKINVGNRVGRKAADSQNLIQKQK